MPALKPHAMLILIDRGKELVIRVGGFEFFELRNGLDGLLAIDEINVLAALAALVAGARAGVVASLNALFLPLGVGFQEGLDDVDHGSILPYSGRTSASVLEVASAASLDYK